MSEMGIQRSRSVGSRSVGQRRRAHGFETSPLRRPGKTRLGSCSAPYALHHQPVPYGKQPPKISGSGQGKPEKVVCDSFYHSAPSKAMEIPVAVRFEVLRPSGRSTENESRRDIMKIARRFNAGVSRPKPIQVPKGRPTNVSEPSAVPSGLNAFRTNSRR